MANSNVPFGLRPVRHSTSAGFIQANEYIIQTSTDGQTTYSNAIYSGDPVIANSTSANQGANSIIAYSPTDNGSDVANLKPLVGSFKYCKWTDPNGLIKFSNYWPGAVKVLPGTLVKAFVYDDPDIIFEILVSTYGTNLDNARFTRNGILMNYGLGLGKSGVQNFTQNVNGVAVTYPDNPINGSSRDGKSAFYLNKTFGTANTNTASGLPLKCIGLSKRVDNGRSTFDNATTDPFLSVEVVINNHFRSAGTAANTLT